MKIKSILLIASIFVLIIGLSLFLNNDRRYEVHSLKNISFEGIKLGDKVSQDIKDNLVMDFTYSHSYKDIFVNYDDNDRVYGLYFSTKKDSDNNYITSIDKVKIEYKGKHIVRLEQLQEFFGKGKKEKNNYVDTYTFTEKNNNKEITLTVDIIDKKIYNVELIME